MLRIFFSSAGTDSILKIKGSLEEYKIQGNCLLQDNLFLIRQKLKLERISLVYAPLHVAELTK